MLRNKYEKSTDLITQFIIQEHYELGRTIDKFDEVGARTFIEYLNILDEKNIDDKNNERKI